MPPLGWPHSQGKDSDSIQRRKDAARKAMGKVAGLEEVQMSSRFDCLPHMLGP